MARDFQFLMCPFCKQESPHYTTGDEHSESSTVIVKPTGDVSSLYPKLPADVLTTSLSTREPVTSGGQPQRKEGGDHATEIPKKPHIQEHVAQKRKIGTEEESSSPLPPAKRQLSQQQMDLGADSDKEGAANALAKLKEDYQDQDKITPVNPQELARKALGEDRKTVKKEANPEVIIIKVEQKEPITSSSGTSDQHCSADKSQSDDEYQDAVSTQVSKEAKVSVKFVYCSTSIIKPVLLRWS